MEDLLIQFHRKPFHGNLLSAEITKLLSRRFFSLCFERTQQYYGITNDIFLFSFPFFPFSFPESPLLS